MKVSITYIQDNLSKVSITLDGKECEFYISYISEFVLTIHFIEGGTFYPYVNVHSRVGEACAAYKEFISRLCTDTTWAKEYMLSDHSKDFYNYCRQLSENTEDRIRKLAGRYILPAIDIYENGTEEEP